jgi:hypothetical protein
MDIWKKGLLRRMQHAQRYAQITNKLDRGIMLGMPASLKGSLHGKPAFARAMFIAGLAIALLPLQTIQTNAAEKRSYHVMNIKLYAYNKMEWKQFQCYNWLIFEESRWNYKARNGSHYGLGQMRSKWYGTLSPYKQIDVHLKYLKHRYHKHDYACKAYQHWKEHSWH